MRLSDKVAVWVEQTLEVCAPGEKVDFEVTLIAMPGPNGQPQPCMMIVITMPSPLIEQGLAATHLLPTIAPQEPAIADMVRGAVEGLRNARTTMLAGQNGHGGPPGPTRPSGLILPGK